MSEFIRGSITVIRGVLQNPDTPFGQKEPILVMRRPDWSDKNPGLWELPGGKLDESDADQFAGVRREIYEKTGFNIKIEGNNLSRIDKYIMQEGAEHNKLYVAYAGIARYISGDFVVDRESAWIHPTNLPDLPFTKHASAAIGLYNECKLGLKDLV